MSFYDDASLVFLPSGGAGKDGKAYSMKPTNGDGDFTFSRGSNLTATRVDSNGLIEKGRENLLLQSNSFDTTWTTSNTSVTSGQSGYDGSSDAWLLEATSAGTSRYIRQGNTNSGVHTFSCYAKAGTTDFIRLQITSSSTAFTYFDLNNGTIGNEDADTIDSTIEDVGSGWYRISITASDSSISQVRIYIAQENTSNVNEGDNVYIQDAQLEIGTIATEYIESGASSGKAGLLENEPRFDYSGGASCASLLLERSRTNLVEYSEYMLGSNWVGSFTTITPVLSDTLSPEGVANCYRITRSGSNTQLGSVVSITSGNTYTGSIYVRKVSGSDTAILKDVNNSSTSIDITTEWKRFHTTATATSGNGRLYIQPQSDGDVIEVFGAQLEEGSYPTSYIPNHSGGSETRDADVTSVTSVSSLIGQTEGTIYCEFEYNGAADSGVFNRIIGLGTGVTQNRILLAKNDTTAELVAFAVTGGTTQVFQAIAGTSIIGHHKVAISYKANEYKVYLDGELEFTDTSASVPATTDVYIGTAEDGTTNNELGGIVKESIIYKEVLSEDNCKALTTL